MHWKLLFEHFADLADGPDAVKKLRRLILQMAVMGKLVPQDPADEPASVLLEKIKAEKEFLIKEGKIKKEKPLPPISKDEIPYELPNGWEWVRLNDICEYIQRGRGPKYVEMSDIPVVSQKCIQWRGFDIEKARFVDPASVENYGEERFLRTGDLLLNSTGTGTLGRINSYYHDENLYDIVVADSHVTVIRPLFIDSQFICKFISSHVVQDGIELRASGTTKQKELNSSTVKATVVPLPPYKEQQRIVAQVDRLMVLCDELAAKKEKREQKRLRLNNACLDKLLSAGQPDQFARHRRCLADNFHLLYSRPETVAQLKQAILQLAVMGKLVPQDPADEPASRLLEKIKAEKEFLIKEGKIKKENPLPPISENDIPYELPKGWEWVRLGDIVQKLGAGSTPRGGKSVYIETGIKFLRSQNVWNDGLRLDGVANIPEDIHKRMSGTHLEPGDILLNITGASIGRSAIIPENFNAGNVSQHVSIIRLVNKSLKDFIHIFIISSYIQKMIMGAQVGISREGLSMASLRFFPIPIPPLNEQHRIVSKVDRLLGLCDRLAESLSDGQLKNQALFDSLIKGLGSRD